MGERTLPAGGVRQLGIRNDRVPDTDLVIGVFRVELVGHFFDFIIVDQQTQNGLDVGFLHILDRAQVNRNFRFVRDLARLDELKRFITEIVHFLLVNFIVLIKKAP